MSPAIRNRACPSCESPVELAEELCLYCGAPNSWGDDIGIERGAEIASAHCPRDLLPSETTRRPAHASGSLVDLGVSRWASGDIGPKIASGCVTIGATCLDENGYFGTFTRQRHHGGIRTGYGVDVCPGTRSFRVVRQLLGKTSHVHRLVGWRTSPAIKRPGKHNQLEVRFAGPWLHVLIGSERVAILNDDAFGYGQSCWHADATSAGPASVVIDHVELFHVR